MARTVLIEKILHISNPVDTPPWDGCDDLRPEMVERCIREGFFVDRMVGAGPASLDVHAARIAWLVLHPDGDAIHLDVGIHGDPPWIIEDGNHRLYAACMRGDQTIEAHISGSYARSLALLGVEPDDDGFDDLILEGIDGRLLEIVTDGSTVWVNGADGMAVGRFSKSGIDVHSDSGGQIPSGLQRLVCFRDLSQAQAWQVFVAAMRDHHGVAIPLSCRPDFVDSVDRENTEIEDRPSP